MAKIGRVKAEQHGSDGDTKLILSAEEAGDLRDLLTQAIDSAAERDDETKQGVVTIEMDGTKLKIGTKTVDADDDEEV